MPPIQEIVETNFDHNHYEPAILRLWQETGIYNFQPNSSKPVFSIDTPPPYVSAAHLHVGHAMSYSQAEFIVRYKRMQGFNIFYPMGFDDNGLPTERYVEQTYKIDKKKTTRAEFRGLCIEETARGAEAYEKMWRALGLSVDWDLRYSTIDEHCRRTAQKSFLELYKKGLIYRSEQPVLWDTTFETSLAQADLESISRKSKLYDINFGDNDRGPLIISTSRPELIPACVGLFFSPGDNRYQSLKGQQISVPIFSFQVPVLESSDVDPQFGTGLMMVCTFGDGEDVKKWKDFHLDTRICLGKDGKMTALAGPYAGLEVNQARAEIVKDLRTAGLLMAERNIDQNVSICERSGVPVEFSMAPQWFIRLLDFKDDYLRRSQELNWFPEHMKVRLDQWIEGLKYDWNISRQRFYGVPFPLWHVEETGEVILANEDDLPIDPLESEPPALAKEKYKGMTIIGESDVMETWMTSSLTPLINANWAESPGKSANMDIYPMSLRVQAFEIIRTWLFYTLAKSHFHTDTLPWDKVMISGWGLNEQGKKISKRDLEQYTDKSGYNRYDPYAIIQKYGADALRYWAAGSRLGHDLRFNEKDVTTGRKLVTKLWNVARLCTLYLKNYDPQRDHIEPENRSVEDRWLTSRLNQVINDVTTGFEAYDYALGREALEKFFWGTYCDNYLEIVKDRFWRTERYSDAERHSAQSTLFESFRAILGLYAPFTPFVTEELYRRIYAESENKSSIHDTTWPKANPHLSDQAAEQEMGVVVNILEGIRAVRTQNRESGKHRKLIIETADDEISEIVDRNQKTILAASRCDEVGRSSASYQTHHPNIKLGLAP